MNSSWHSGGRAAAWRAALGTTVLAAAAAVLVAHATGALGAHAADAATPPPGSAPAAQAAASSANGDARRHLQATVLTHLPENVTDPTRGVAVRLNGAPRPGTPRPKLTPATAGTWTDLGNYEFFHPTSTLEPCAKYTMTIPAGTVAAHHRHLGAPRTVSFDVACPGITAVQEALARLNYLPYTLHGFVGASSTAAITRAEAAKRAFDLPHGILKANVPDAPPLTMGELDPATTGAMEVFEGQHNLPISTTVTQGFWTELMAEETLAKSNPDPYTWVTVTETLPETLEVHRGAKMALSTPANTGVPGADTQKGIFPIYVRYVATTMIGVNVDGSHYNDPGVPWVNYFNGGDASTAETAERGVALARERFGGVDALVNNAARFLLKPLIDTSDEEWDGLFASNVRSVFVQTRAALPSLIASRGAIVNLASISGVLGLSDQAAYCATKGAIVQITRQVAIQHARDGVRVNAVAPGAVETLFVARSLGTEDQGSGITDEMAASHPLGRVAQPRDIAEVVLFLASPRSGVMTGAVVMADCGYSAQ